jgi:hypothetical protein
LAERVAVVAPVFQEYVDAPLAVMIVPVPAHMVGDETASVGELVTLMAAVAEFVHEPVVPTTEYVVVVDGDTTILEVVAPVFHE